MRHNCYLLASAILAVFAISSTRLNAELVAFWDFNDPSNADIAKDVTGRGNDGDIFGAAYTADGGGHTGKAGDRALDFGFYNDGTWVEIPSAADGAFDSLTDNDSFTLSMWIFGSDEQPQPQWNFYAGPGRQFGAHIPWSDTVIYFDVAGCCNAMQRINLQEPDDTKWAGQWNHYLFLKREDYTAIYQNGDLFHDSTDTGPKNPLGTISELFIGSGPPGDVRDYSGLIDDVGIWDEALTDAQILDVFNNRIPGLGGGIVGDFNGDGVLDAADIDALSVEVKAGTNQASFDLTNDGKVDDVDRRTWVADLKKTWFGDADLNGEFTSGDFVRVFQVGKYETDQAAGWAEGDWNGDARFNSGDFVVAFQDGGFERGPRAAAAAVPEPATTVTTTLLLIGMAWLRGRTRRNAPC